MNKDMEIICNELQINLLNENEYCNDINKDFNCTYVELNKKIDSAIKFNMNAIGVVIYPTENSTELETLYSKFMSLDDNGKMTSNAKAEELFGKNNREVYDLIKSKLDQEKIEDTDSYTPEVEHNESSSIFSNDLPLLTPRKLFERVDENYSCFTESEAESIKRWRQEYALMGMGIKTENYNKYNLERINILRKAIHENNNDAIIQCGWNPEIEFNSENRVKASNIVREKMENISKFSYQKYNDKFIKKDKYKLSFFRKEPLVNKSKEDKRINWMIKEGMEIKGYSYYNENDLVAAVSVIEKNKIISIYVNNKYRGHGLSKQLLNVACKNLGGTCLYVDKKNKLAVEVYKKYGFEITEEDNNEYFMIYKGITNESYIEEFKIIKPKKCTKCGSSDIGIFLYGEPIFKCKECGEYLGTVPFPKNESYIEEGFIINEKDIYYNKDKFDSGEINLCFITGHSGSGKSTMARNISGNKIEHYELDDVVGNSNFSDENLKEYGDLIYSFFKGSGKKYRNKTLEQLENNFSNYEKEIITDFIKYSLTYCKLHKNTKYILEGIWLFWMIKPEVLKEYAVYIKGTSALISALRAAKRDFKESNKPLKYNIKWTMHRIFEDAKNMRAFENNIKKYRNYFSKQSTNESYIEESTNKQDKKAVSLVFVAGSSTLAKTIRKVQGTEFSHASISLDDDLSRIYSFNMRNGFNGFTYESVKNYINEGVTKMGVYTFLVSNKVYNALEKSLNNFSLYIHQTKYSVLNLLTIPINIPLDIDMKMVCSEFVDKLLKTAELDLTNKKSSLVGPKDLINATKIKPNIIEVYNGHPSKFNPKEAEKKIKKLKKSNLPIYEFVEIEEGFINESSKIKLYHLSENNLNGKTLQPKVPSNFLTKNGYEDKITKRICFSTSVNGCLRGLSQNLTDKEFYVHIPDKEYNTYKPTIKEVPDSKITNEVWIKEPVKLKCIGKIKVHKDSEEDGFSYKYGNHTAELYDWDWSWIGKISESYIEEAKSFPMQFDSEGNLILKNLRKINFEQEYADSHRLLIEYDKTNSYDPMKFELAKMQFFITLLEKKIYKQGKDKSKDELKVRARFLNDFKKYLKIINNNDPNFNFTEYYEQSPFNDALIQINKSTLKFGYEALKYLVK